MTARQHWTPGTSANSNLPDRGSFSELATETRALLSQANALSLSACVFALGEKLAACRTRETPPDAGTLAELNAVYATLADDFEQRFFAPHAAMEPGALSDMVYHDPSAQMEQTPADVRVMVELYQAVWRLHYEEFNTDPATALSNWDIGNHYQTRAMRAALFDMDYAQLLKIAVVLLDSAEATLSQPCARKVRDAVTAKRDLVLTVVWQRAETPRDVAAQVSKGEGAVNRALLMQLLKTEMERKQQRRLETFYADILPFAKPASQRGAH